MMFVIFGLAVRTFFRFNGSINAQTEAQISALESRDLSSVLSHFKTLRRREVRLSDLESFVYGLILLVLLAMLVFNLWFSAATLNATPGDLFAIVSYSVELVEAAVTLPVALQTLTRLSEIVGRINRQEQDT